MAMFTTRAMSLVGIEGAVVEVEADVANGLPAFTLVGLPDASLSESRDRVRAALVNSGFGWPARRLTVNLSPASLPKHGSIFDLAIAAAVLGCGELIAPTGVQSTVLLGELGLDGRVRPVRGVLPAVLAAVRAGMKRVIVPEANGAEAALVPGIEVIAVASLGELVAFTKRAPGEGWRPPTSAAVTGEQVAPGRGAGGKDMSEVLGQPVARWALEIAAAGGHHLLLVGPPGAGKTMLAERLPGLLPALHRREALDVTALHSLAGTLRADGPLVDRPPFQQPHHTATVAAMVGGGSGALRPGAASLAHRGVLFLDEAPEFRSAALQALREPLESGSITLARAAAFGTFPARFQLVLAANPCPCGRASSGPPAPGTDCVCPSHRRRTYFSKLSGPLLDRVDLRLEVSPPGIASLLPDTTAEASAPIAARVHEARERARHRFGDAPWHSNGDVPAHAVRSDWPVDARISRHLHGLMTKGVLSMRGADRVLRVAWTLADLAGETQPRMDEVRAAMALRTTAVAS